MVTSSAFTRAKALILRQEWFGGLIGDPHTYNLRVLNHFAFNQMKAEIESVGCFSTDTLAFLQAARLNVDQNEQPRIVCNQIPEKSDLILSAPVILWIELTSNCPLRCKHCFRQPFTENLETNHLPTQLALSLVRQAQKIGVFKITLTGGEALIHPEADLVMAAINKAGLGLRLFSSGTLETSTYQRLSKHRIDTFFLSMDGTKNHHQLLRGNNSFEKLTKTIKTLSSIKSITNITLSVTLDRINSEHIEDIIIFADKHHIRTLLVRPLIIDSKTSEISELSFSDKASLLHALENMESVAQKYGIECQINKLPYFPINKKTYLDDGKDNASIWNILGIEKSIDCVGGNLVCGVRNDGTISPCGFLPYQEETGMMKTNHEIDLADEWINSQALKKMHCITPNNNCAECGHLLICNGGCRANSMLAGTGIDGIDPYCLIHDTPYGSAMHPDRALIKPTVFPMNEDTFFVSPKNLVSKCGWATYEN